MQALRKCDKVIVHGKFISNLGKAVELRVKGAAMRPLEKWCRLQREVFRAQLGRLEGHRPNPFNDYHEPLLFADTPLVKERLREWVATLDQLLGE